MTRLSREREREKKLFPFAPLKQSRTLAFKIWVSYYCKTFCLRSRTLFLFTASWSNVQNLPCVSLHVRYPTIKRVGWNLSPQVFHLSRQWRIVVCGSFSSCQENLIRKARQQRCTQTHKTNQLCTSVAKRTWYNFFLLRFIFYFNLIKIHTYYLYVQNLSLPLHAWTATQNKKNEKCTVTKQKKLSI